MCLEALAAIIYRFYVNNLPAMASRSDLQRCKKPICCSCPKCVLQYTPLQFPVLSLQSSMAAVQLLPNLQLPCDFNSLFPFDIEVNLPLLWHTNVILSVPSFACLMPDCCTKLLLDAISSAAFHLRKSETKNKIRSYKSQLSVKIRIVFYNS